MARKTARTNKTALVAASAIDTFRTDFSPKAIAKRDAAHAALLAEIEANEAAAPQIIDHHTQIGSWDMTEKLADDEAAEIAEILAASAVPVEEASPEAAALLADEPSVLDEKFEEFAEANPESTAGEFARSISGADEITELTPEVEAELLKTEIAAEPETIETETNEPQAVDFSTVLQSFDDATVTDMTFAIAKAIDERTAFEEHKSETVTGKTSIFSTLKKVRTELVTKRAARVMLATQIEPDFINRSLHDGSRYNVYALGKFADLVRALADGDTLKNAINVAVTTSLFRCKNAGVPFTGEIARAAASNKIRIDPSIASKLVRHTVSASTAPTQASSTMAALATLGVVTNEGSSRNPTYRVTDAPIAKFLEQKLLAA